MAKEDVCDTAHHGEVALVVGAGPGLGTALARRFAKAGMQLALAARDTTRFAALIEEFAALGVTAHGYGCDATHERSVVDLLAMVRQDLGVPSLVIYNVEHFGPGSVLDIEVAEFEDCWRAMCLGGFLVGREAARMMVGRSRGSIVYTGATGSLRGRAGYLNLAVGKFGVRALAQVMARELGPKGIHVAHVIIDGGILPANSSPDAERRGSALNPTAIAETIFHLHQQQRSTWTQELDLRPWVEKF
jgi:NAD(P)-dependent dehydrogenase (short-subunit alcohol dehydrogenase family)